MLLNKIQFSLQCYQQYKQATLKIIKGKLMFRKPLICVTITQGLITSWEK